MCPIMPCRRASWRRRYTKTSDGSGRNVSASARKRRTGRSKVRFRSLRISSLARRQTGCAVRVRLEEEKKRLEDEERASHEANRELYQVFNDLQGISQE